MELKEQLLKLKNRGISMKYISQETHININTIYAFTSGKRKLSPEKEEKILKFIWEKFGGILNE